MTAPNPAQPDPFARPLQFSSGVRWEPTDYKPIGQTEYRRFAAERGPNSQ